MFSRTLFCTLAGVLLTTPAFPQELHLRRPSSRTGSPVDPAADPCFHRLIANDRVRAFRVEITPHQSTAFNRHPYDYLIVSLNGAQLEAAGSTNALKLEMDSGEMQVMKGGWPHRLRNMGDEPSYLLEVEITRGIEPERAACGLGNRTCTDGEFRKTEEGSYTTSTLFETPTVKLRKVSVTPGGSMPRHRHPGGDLIIALNPLKLDDEFGDGAVQLGAGEVLWLRPGADHGPQNTGAEEARFLELELK
jgi:quercetin dioxygenase-like cupin family protein